MKVFSFLLSFLLTVPAFSQVPEVTFSSIPEGATNVALNSELYLDFSMVLDYSEYEDEPGDSPFHFIGMVLVGGGEGSSIDSGDYSLSMDHTALRLYLTLEEETVYQFRAWGAFGGNGERMVDFYLNFTTGSAMPTASISGTVGNLAGGNYAFIIAVPDYQTIFETDFNSYTDFFRAGLIDMETGSFTMEPFPAGAYHLYAVEDVMGDERIDIELGDRIGIYDPDADGTPNSVVVEGQSVAGISFNLFSPVVTGTSAGREAATLAATNWDPGAQLIGLMSTQPLDTTGKAGMWMYIFQNVEASEYLTLIVSDDDVLLKVPGFAFEEEEFEFMFPGNFYPQWMNSEEIVPGAWNEFRNGEYYDSDYPVTLQLILAGFSLSFIDFEQDQRIPLKSWPGKQLITKIQQSRDSFRWMNSLSNGFDTPDDQPLLKPLWNVEFYQEIEDDEFNNDFSQEFAINALTGTILRFEDVSARDLFSEFTVEADKIGSKEYITAIFNPEYNPEDVEQFFALIAFDPEEKYHHIYFGFGNFLIEFPFLEMPYLPFFFGTRLPVGSEWIPESQAVAVADQWIENEFGPLEFIPSRFVTLYRENQYYPFDKNLYWNIEYFTDFENNNGLLLRRNPSDIPDYGVSVRINAVTGELIVDSLISAGKRMVEVINQVTAIHPDAELIACESLGMVSPDGEAVGWSYLCAVPGIRGAVRGLASWNDISIDTVWLPTGFIAKNEGVTVFQLDSKAAYSAVKAEYGEIGPSMRMALVNRYAKPVWIIIGMPEGDLNDPGVTDFPFDLFIVDANTGDLFEREAVGTGDKAGLRGVYAMLRSYDVKPELKFIYTENTDTLGHAPVWVYAFSDAGTEQSFMLMTASGVHVPMLFPVYFDAVELVKSTNSIPPGWLDVEDLAVTVQSWLMDHPLDMDIEGIYVALTMRPVMEASTPDNEPYWHIMLEGETDLQDTTVVISVHALTGEIYTDVDDEVETVNQLKLMQNYPNPFNPSTTISFTVPETAITELSVYNLLGQKIETILDGVVSAGMHTVQFDATRLASGVYLYSLRQGNQVEIKRLMVIK